MPAPAEEKKDGQGPTPLFQSSLTWESLLAMDGFEAAKAALKTAVFTDRTIPMGEWASLCGQLSTRFSEKKQQGNPKSPLDALIPAAMVGVGGAGAVALEIGDRLEKLVKGDEMEIYAEATPSRLLERIVLALDRKKFAVAEGDSVNPDSTMIEIFQTDKKETFDRENEKPLLRVLVSYRETPEELFDLEDAYIKRNGWTQPMRKTTTVRVSPMDEGVLKGHATDVVQQGMDVLISLADKRSTRDVLGELSEAMNAGMDAKAVAGVMKKVCDAIEDVAREVEDERSERNEIITEMNTTYLKQLKTAVECEACSTERGDGKSCPQCGAPYELTPYSKEEAKDRLAGPGVSV